MAISDELRAQILRYHHVEKWRVGTISRQLNVHHSTIKRVLSGTRVKNENLLAQNSMIEPFLPFIMEKLQLFPAKRPLMAFAMVLSYSRKIYLHFYLNQRTENFMRGHEGAFKAFSGLPRVILYDNLKSAILKRSGDAIRFNPQLLAFAAHYRFEPRPCAPYRGNEKGRVERVIRYVRDNFFAAREWSSLDDLNAQAKIWCDTHASQDPALKTEVAL